MGIDKRPLILTVLWGVSVVVGVAAMMRYRMTPGPGAIPPARLILSERPAKAEMLVFLHPQCGCSMATVHEIQKIVSAAGTNLDLTLYFFRPSSQSEAWCRDTPLWRSAMTISGAHLLIDRDGSAARYYGAHCSGQVLLYASRDGNLVFSGGVTESRGHEGASAGGDSVVRYLRTGSAPLAKSEVYGCVLW